MDHVSPARQHDADDAPAGPGRGPARRLTRALFLTLCLALAAGFAALGVWQLERLAWKEALIATVDARLSAAPIAPPAFDGWDAQSVYTRVAIDGEFLHDRETAVQAVTDLGPGWWILTPLRTADGIILINRGFVPTDLKSPSSRPEGQPTGQTHVTGLLRATEPNGAFLRSNAPDAERWYSRDVVAIARAHGLTGPIAPYFIDADATPNPGGYPVGGLTIVRFPNSHLIYALTWFGLCGLSLGGAVLVWRQGGRR